MQNLLAEYNMLFWKINYRSHRPCYNRQKLPVEMAKPCEDYYQRSSHYKHGRIQRGEQAGPDTPPWKITKNIGFLSNTGLGPLKNHKNTKPAFNVGSSSICQRNAFWWHSGTWIFPPLITPPPPHTHTHTHKNAVKVGPHLTKLFRSALNHVKITIREAVILNQH